MPYTSSIEKLFALATAPKRKFWITDGIRRSAARDLAERAETIAAPADRLAAAELFGHYPRESREAVPALRAWLAPAADPLDASTGAAARAERKALTALRTRAAHALSVIGAPAMEALGDLRAARAVERDDAARSALQSAIERLERLKGGV